MPVSCRNGGKRMKKKYTMILAGLVALGSIQAQAGVEENFESYTQGDLGGQGGWIASPDPVHYSQAQIVDGRGTNTSKVISNTLDAKAGLMSKEISPDWSSRDMAVLSVDLYRGGDGSGIGTWAGFSSSKTMRGYGVRLETVSLKFRTGATGGAAVTHTDADGNDIRIKNNVWYRLTYEFSPAANEIRKAMLHNLTDGGSVQLYFGANKPSHSPEAAANPLAWNQMLILSGKATTGTVMFDNVGISP